MILAGVLLLRDLTRPFALGVLDGMCDALEAVYATVEDAREAPERLAARLEFALDERAIEEGEA